MKKSPKSDQDKNALEINVRLSATDKFKQEFTSRHFIIYEHEKNLIDDCSENFGKMLDVDLLTKLVGFLEIGKHGQDPITYLHESFIAVFDLIYRPPKEEK